MKDRYLKYIEREINRPLSSIDIENILDNKCKIILYPELINYSSIDELLKPYGCVIILYMHKKINNNNSFYGHWCCIFKIKDKSKTIEFFDPYGHFCDDQLNTKALDRHFRIENGLVYPLLSYLLFYTGTKYNLTFNHYKFQGPDSSTCGRHCCVRLLNKDLSLTKYNKYMKSFGINYDLLVTILTDNILTNNIND